ncbi:hypothetical protein K466DRAFT_581979 [Polyporus arcularius HHB13444]|uniref:PH domain-containing protein n=1 Tax=Polyporus arcularius HHB13444 TaxID=1314778 RepID=A0A5C3Q1Q1_9APHY|nr:hypothetical protein K466DRAFT_581979 [Polyporus arcularius HHB13444]
MSTTYTTATKEGRPQLLFLKKVSTFRNIRRKSESRASGDTAYARSARSMDLGSKALAKVEVRAHHHSFDHSGDSGEDSPSHVSLRSPSNLRNSSQFTDTPLTAPPRAIDGLPNINTSAPFATVIDASSPSSMHTRAQTLPSPASSGSEVPNGNAAQSATMDGRARRAIAPRLATLPPPLMAQYAAGGSARLTPSLVARQPPMPLLNLPTLPPPTPAQPARPARPTAPLRSIPALPMQGPSDADQDADHENASLEEEEDEEDGDDNADGHGHDAGSEESGDEDDESSPPPTSCIAGPSRLPQVDVSGFSVSFGDAGLGSSTPRTPHPPAVSPVDYFSSKSPEPAFSPLRTPRPNDYRPNGKARAIDGVPQPRLVPMPATPASPRPGLYHQASKSMVDLSAMTRKDKGKVFSPKLARTAPMKAQTLGLEGQAPAAGAEEPVPTAESPDDVITSPMLRRRCSLPVYEPSSDPPPYPDPLFRRRGPPLSQPLEEEGREELPPYSNSIYLSGVMPRKMEFSQPGVQSKDRKWRRVYCVLEGTAFRVYKSPPPASGVGAIEQWWENRVGVGDRTSVSITAVTSTGVRVSAIRERQRESPDERIPKILEESPACQDTPTQPAPDRPGRREPSPSPAPTKSKLGLASRILRKERSKSVDRLRTDSANSSRTRLSMDSRSESARQSSSATSRHSMDTLGSSRLSNAPSTVSHSTTSTSPTSSTGPSPTSASSSASSESGSRFSRSRLLTHHSSRREHAGAEKDKDKLKEDSYTPDPKDLIRQYSLQHAESGLASDYHKRRNVIRVRMEGEQFLLQAKDVAAVIDWIEGIQMGTNVALDLDERPMPRGPIFPRRRRRRARRVDPAGATSS